MRLMIYRRVFMASLLAPFSSFSSKIGHQPKTAGKLTIDRPADLPLYAKHYCYSVFDIRHVQEAVLGCTFGNERPNVISVSQEIWNRIWCSIHPLARSWYLANSSLRKRGYRSFVAFDAEVVVDRYLAPAEMWIINTNHLADRDLPYVLGNEWEYHRHLTFAQLESMQYDKEIGCWRAA